MVDLPLDWNALAAAGSMVGSGAIVVCAEDRCMLDMALNAVRFFRNESCGKCVPCRMGRKKWWICSPPGPMARPRMTTCSCSSELSHAMKVTSICGLGQSCPSPLCLYSRIFGMWWISMWSTNNARQKSVSVAETPRKVR